MTVVDGNSPFLINNRHLGAQQGAPKRRKLSHPAGSMDM